MKNYISYENLKDIENNIDLMKIKKKFLKYNKIYLRKIKIYFVTHARLVMLYIVYASK